MNIKIEDDAGQPFVGAEVAVVYGVGYKNGKEVDETIKGQSDANGVFKASHQDTRSRSLGMTIQKDGYYPVHVVYDLSTSYDAERWNINETWTLKKIVNPIPMYAKTLGYLIATNGAPVGLDLKVGDWVAPYGKGEHSDMFFTTQFDQRSKNDYDFKLTVSFPNAGDGIQPFSIPATRFPGDGSALRSPHTAPEGGYEPQLVKTDSLRPGQLSKYLWNENTNFFFRVQTVLDEKRNVKSAFYGKIYGDFNHFRFYLNPTPNDRNVEFDPKRNMMQGLKSFEQVAVP